MILFFRVLLFPASNDQGDAGHPLSLVPLVMEWLIESAPFNESAKSRRIGSLGSEVEDENEEEADLDGGDGGGGGDGGLRKTSFSEKSIRDGGEMWRRRRRRR